MIDLREGDCLEVMKQIPDKSIDMVFADLPYGVTAKNDWDTRIPLVALWKLYDSVVKDGGAIVLTATEPFTSILVMSNLKNYRHKWIWNKNNSAGFANAKRQPFQITEDVLVFSNKGVNYYPIMEERGKPRNKGGYSNSDNYFITPSKNTEKNNLYYPKNILNYGNASQVGKLHPTQKPLGLVEYLIKTYTLEGQTVLDNVMGSGTTGVACINTGRSFIGIEKDHRYFAIAKERIEKS